MEYVRDDRAAVDAVYAGQDNATLLAAVPVLDSLIDAIGAEIRLIAAVDEHAESQQLALREQMNELLAAAWGRPDVQPEQFQELAAVVREAVDTTEPSDQGATMLRTISYAWDLGQRRQSVLAELERRGLLPRWSTLEPG